MKHAMWLILLVVTLGVSQTTLAGDHGYRYSRGIGLNGLAAPSCGWVCETCPPVGYMPARPMMAPTFMGMHPQRLGWHHGAMVDPGPPSAAITYPYYTVRGPRDFFQKNPTPIGP